MNLLTIAHTQQDREVILLLPYNVTNPEWVAWKIFDFPNDVLNMLDARLSVAHLFCRRFLFFFILASSRVRMFSQSINRCSTLMLRNKIGMSVKLDHGTTKLLMH